MAGNYKQLQIPKDDNSRKEIVKAAHCKMD